MKKLAYNIQAKDYSSQVALVKIGEVVKVVYNGHKSPVIVTITDEDGNEVLTEKVIAQKSFIRPYNFSHLPEGEYFIHIEDEEAQWLESIAYEKENWAIIAPHVEEKENAWVSHMIRLNTPEKKYLLTIPVPDSGNTDIAIHIYDKDGKLVHTDLEKNAQSFARVYHLKMLNEGVTFQIVNKNSGQIISFNAD